MESDSTIIILIGFFVGTVFPPLIALLLPRKKTIGFGSFIYKSLGLILVQKRAHNIPIPHSALEKALIVIRSTFADVAFGIYIASRIDWTDKQRKKKMEEYLNATGSGLSDGN